MATWRAPGRINLIGEHTDYNDGFVLPFALALGCTATVEASRRRMDRPVASRSRRRSSYDAAGWPLRRDVPGWSRYVLGALWLLTDRGVDVPPLRLTVDSDVPTGAGLSSSAALVCSVVRAVDDHLGLGLDDDALLALTRDVENDAVGAPTGGMDQLVSLRGVAGHALFCDMRDTTTRAVPFEPAARRAVTGRGGHAGTPPPLRR